MTDWYDDIIAEWIEMACCEPKSQALKKITDDIESLDDSYIYPLALAGLKFVRKSWIKKE